MSTVAEQLHQGREAKKLTIEQVAEITKIRTDHLRALEESNFNVFSAPVYIRGFVRTYSTLLKLEVPKVMAQLDAELGQTRKFAEPPPLTPHSKGILDFAMLQLSKLDWRKGLVLAALLLLVAGVLIARVLRHHPALASEPAKPIKPPLYQAPPAAAGNTLPLPPAVPSRR